MNLTIAVEAPQAGESVENPRLWLDSMTNLYEGPSPFGPLLVTWSATTRTLTLFQGGYLQSRSDPNGIAKTDYVHAMVHLARQGGKGARRCCWAVAAVPWPP